VVASNLWKSVKPGKEVDDCQYSRAGSLPETQSGAIGMTCQGDVLNGYLQKLERRQWYE